MANILSYKEAKQHLGRTPVYGDALYSSETGERIWESNAKPKCHICHKQTEVIMEIGRQVEDWIFRVCQSCDEHICESCFDVVQVEDPMLGSVYENECTDCYGIRISQ